MVARVSIVMGRVSAAYRRGATGWVAWVMLSTMLPAAGRAQVDQTPSTGLPVTVVEALARHKLPADALSVFVQRAGDAAPLVAHHADVARNPASLIKLLTTFIALDVLGPTWRWRTEAFIDGPLDGGRLAGDLILRGGGDPSLVTERLWLFQRALRSKGLQHIDGELVIDNSFFAREETDPGAFDGQPYRSYNTLPDALLVNFQTANFLFRPDPVHGRVEILADPALADIEIRNRMRVFRGGCDARNSSISMVAGNDDRRRPVLTFSGALAAQCTEYQLSRALPNAPAFAHAVFKALWQEQGGTLAGGWRVGTAPSGRAPLAAIESPPLAEVIRSVNKYSNNVMTRHIFLTLGVAEGEGPATLDKSRQVVGRALRRHGLEFPELRVVNGAGLSRDTRISARSLGRLLLAVGESPLRAEFQASMSLAGLDGTTQRRFRRDPLAGRSRLKTGSLDGVSAIAGYVLSRSGEEYVVVVIANAPRATWGGGQEAQNALLRWVYGR